MPRLLGISGSIRRGSANTAILEALRLRLAGNEKADLTLFDLAEIPPYNSDIDGEAPPAPVQALKQAIQESDGLVLCTPEYNGGTSGVLKNALDWASRPALNSPLKGKPVLIMSSSPSFGGGISAQNQVRETLVSCLSRVVVTQPVVIALVFEKFVNGVFENEANLSFAERAVDNLIAEIRRPPA
jgi:chromate reductase